MSDSNDLVEMVRIISDKYGLGWDDESILAIFSTFIEDHCDTRSFEEYVHAIAGEQNEVSEQLLKEWGPE